MASDASRAGLWLYRQVRRTGLLSVGPIRRAYELVYAAYKRRVEDPFYNLARRHPELFKGGHIIDAGANIGYTSSLFASAIDPGFRVWAFEPSSDNFERMCAAIDELHRRRRRGGLPPVITATRAAVADRSGTIELMLNPDHPGDHRVATAQQARAAAAPAGGVERVRLTTIDEEVRAAGISPVAFIKIDVQGCELQVCRGMTRTLDDNPSVAVAVEFAPSLIRTYGDDPDALPLFFASRAYEAFRLTQRGELEPMGAADFRGELPSRGYIDVLFRRPRAEPQT